VSAPEWVLITVAWLFGFLPGIWLGSAWTRESVRQDRIIDDGLADIDGLTIDRGRMVRPDDERR
jgi:hypothetical protein